MGRILSLITILLLLITTAFAAPDPVRVSVTPQVGMARLWVRARITIEPDDANRKACIEVREDDLVQRSSCWTLDGSNSPRTFYKEYKDLDAGEFDIVVRIERSTGNKTSLPAHVKVLGIE